MRLFDETKLQGFDIYKGATKIHCKCFQDNNGAIAIARVPKVRPRTKHINLKYFHFLEYTSDERNPRITLHKISTDLQPADTLTKALDVISFVKHRLFIWGW